MTIKLLAFAGATRAGSFNKRLIRIAADVARAAGAEVTLIDLRDHALPLFDGDLEDASGVPAAGLELKRLFKAHQGLLLSCPEYNSSITGVLKNTFDWVSRPVEGEAPLECFKGKVVGLLSASPGALGGLRGLVTVRSILSNIGAIVLPDQFALSRADQAFDEAGALRDAKQHKGVERVVHELVRVATKLAG
jgi:NAD(P)H-dependent FMN reductase